MQNNKGFTVLELVVVLAIGVVMVAIAVGKISSGVPGHHLNGAALTLRTELNNAKTQALQDGVQYKVTVSGNSYSFWKGTLASGAAFPSATETKNLPYPDVSLSGGDFIFDPRGTASSTADIVLTNEAGTRTFSVSIAGRIRSS